MSTIVPFRDDTGWVKEKEDELKKLAEKLAAAARSTEPPEAALSGQPGVLISKEPAYTRVRSKISALLAEFGYDDPKNCFIEIADFTNESLLLNRLRECSVLITDIRPPYIPLDLLGVVHGTAIPTLRLCSLARGERQEKLEESMGLVANTANLIDAMRTRLPSIYAGYKLDDQMRPILFWRRWSDLEPQLGKRLELLQTKMSSRNLDQIDTLGKARQYFLELGRVPGKVFISNASELNPFVKELVPKLDVEGIRYFHYRQEGQIPTGSPDFQTDLERAIGESAVFIALIDENYARSDWCMDELKEALGLFRKGRLLLHPYLLKKGVGPPPILGRMHATPLHELDQPLGIATILADTVDGLEIEKRVVLSNQERSALEQALKTLLAQGDSVEAHLSDAGFSAEFRGGLDRANSTELVQDLLSAARRSLPEAHALGRFVYSLAPYAPDKPDRRHLARIVGHHRLLPDIRVSLGAEPYYETGLAYYQSGEFQLFPRIADGVPEDPSPIEDTLEGELEQRLVGTMVNAAGYSDEWESDLVAFGRQLGQRSALRELRTKIDQLIRDNPLAEEEIGICVAGDRSLVIPFEWAIEEGERSPLCLRHPVRRFLTGVGACGTSIRTKLLNEPAWPLKVLLVAANTGDIEQADEEVESLKTMFQEWFDTLGWPHRNIRVLSSRKASPKALEEAIANGGYDLFHLAGHGANDGDLAGIALHPGRSKSGFKFVSADTLNSWIKRSPLRFVYLGCCHGAAPGTRETEDMVVRYDNLAHAVVKARVPEVVSFLWPVDDKEVKDFALKFYEHYFTGLHAASALHAARQTFEHNQQIIASPVLYSQVSTHEY